MHTTNTKQLIIKYIQTYQPVTAHSITEHFKMNKTVIHRHLKDLIMQDKIYKEGRPPKVAYYAK